MAKKLTFKQVIFSTFRELFIHHHTSLEFRAKLFALIIAAGEKHDDECALDIVKKCGMDIYDNNERASMLTMTTKEFINNVVEENDYGLDSLIHSIMDDIKAVPRYAQKIDPAHLKELLSCSVDNDSKIYQERVIEFLERLKQDHLKE